MNVQDLFIQADPELVFYAYTLIAPVFSDYDEHSLSEKSIALKYLKGHIEETCERISNCDLDYSCEPKTVFVTEMSETEYGESYKKTYSCDAIQDREAMEVLHTDSKNDDSEGISKIQNYGLDFVSIEELANYSVAVNSVENMGAEVCCACILWELFLWGFTEEKREESFEQLKKNVDEAMTNLDEASYVSLSDFMDEMDEEYFSDISEEYKEYMKCEKEFEKKVKKIKDDYAERILKKNYQIFMDAIKCEYTNR